MAMDSKHPSYVDMQEAWEICKDFYLGSLKVKKESFKYLKPTSGQIQDGATKGYNTIGGQAYQAYRDGAYVPDIYSEAVQRALGAMHRKPPLFELPPSMEIMRDNCTPLGESLEMLLVKINAQQLISGRLGILGDLRNLVNDKGEKYWTPIITLYKDTSPLNWDDTSQNEDTNRLTLVVLDESSHVMSGDLEWQWQERYRVVAMGDGQRFDPDSQVYMTGVADKTDTLDTIEFVRPSFMGKTLNQIPFTFINSRDLDPTPMLPPFLGLALLCWKIYATEATYAHNLFMQGQDTFVTKGLKLRDGEILRLGAGAHLNLPSDGAAEYVGVQSQGLPEQRLALENYYSKADQKSTQLSLTATNSRQSGESLRIRKSDQTNSLPNIAKAGAAGLQFTLRSMAPWFNADPEEIVVTPNLDFTDDVFEGDTFVDLINGKNLGGPISWESIHEWMVDQGATKKTFEEEMQAIAQEQEQAGL